MNWLAVRVRMPSSRPPFAPPSEMDSAMRTRSSSESSSSSVDSPAQLRRLASQSRVSSQTSRNGMQQQRHQRQTSSAGPSSNTAGSLLKLAQLAVIGLLLALIVPFVRSQLASPPSSLSSNNKVKDTYHAAQSLAVKQPSDRHPDVFDFKHEDYLRKPSQAIPEDEALVPVGTVRDLPATSKLASVSTATTPAKYQQQYKSKKNQQQQQQARKPRERENADENDKNTQHDWSFAWLAHVFSVMLHLLTFLSIPFRLLYRSVAYLAFKSYHGFRWSLSHTLRPVAFGLAPLFYLFQGLSYIFVQVPIRLVTAAIVELYPLYLFLGAASVLGITMGLMAAAVLYISSFIFTDRFQSQRVHKTERVDRKGKGMSRRSSSRHRRRSRESKYNGRYNSYDQLKQESPFDQRSYSRYRDQGENFESVFHRAWPANVEASSNEPTPPSDKDAGDNMSARNVDDQFQDPSISPSSAMQNQTNYFQFPGQGSGNGVDYSWSARRGSTPSDSPLPSPAAYRSANLSGNPKLSYPIGATARHKWGASTPSSAVSPSASRSTKDPIDFARSSTSSGSSSSISANSRLTEDHGNAHSPIARKRRS